MKLGVLASHPIQYQAPLFRALAREVDLRVFFAHRQTPAQHGDAGFGEAFDWDVDLLAGYEHQFLQNRAWRPGVDHFFGCDSPQIAAEIAHGGFDGFVVGGWHLLSYWQAQRACRRFDVPVLVRGDSQLATPRPTGKRWVKRTVYPRLLRRFDGFLFVGQRNREYLVHYGVPAERLFFAPHCVDVEWFAARAAASASEAEALRGAWSGGADARLALFVGKLVARKRPQDFLQALREARARGSDMHGVVVGSGELRDELQRFASDAKLPVQFLGFRNQSELPPIYAAADAVVLPSTGAETWGLVVNEAMACGTPAVVSTSAGCAPDLIEEGITGHSYRVADVGALVTALGQTCRLKGDAALKPALARKSREYSVAAAAQGVLEAVTALGSQWA